MNAGQIARSALELYAKLDGQSHSEWVGGVREYPGRIPEGAVLQVDTDDSARENANLAAALALAPIGATAYVAVRTGAEMGAPAALRVPVAVVTQLAALVGAPILWAMALKNGVDALVYKGLGSIATDMQPTEAPADIDTAW